MKRSSPTFGELMAQSVIVQGLLALIVVAGGFALLIMRIDVPDWLIVIISAVVGFFFGAKGVQSAQRIAADSHDVVTAISADFAFNMRAAMAENNAILVKTLKGAGVIPDPAGAGAPAPADPPGGGQSNVRP